MSVPKFPVSPDSSRPPVQSDGRGAFPFIKDYGDLDSLHRFLILVVFISRHLKSLPNRIGVTFLMIGSDSASSISRAHKSRFGYLRYIV